MSLLLPARARLAGVALPAQLARLLGRADHAAQQAGNEAQLSRHFRLLPNHWSPAALTRVVDASEADTRMHAWLRADPAYIRPDINGARLLGIGDMLGLDASDADALLPALRPLFGDAGFILDAPHPARWYLRLPREAKLPMFTSPDLALGDDVFEHTPDAPEARRWRALLSEAQVVLHNHPHNSARLAAGRPPVNSLWFWGGGALPDHVSANHPIIFSDDALLHGLARVGKLEVMPLGDFTAIAADALVDLRALRDGRALLDRWLLPACARAAKHQVVLDFADGHAFTLTPRQRWRIWRRPLSIPCV